MALKVEGTSVTSWSLLVRAASESEPSESAPRIVRCIHRLLSQGWRLVDPSQTADLLEALKEVDDAEPATALLPTTLPQGPASLGSERS